MGAIQKLVGKAIQQDQMNRQVGGIMAFDYVIVGAGSAGCVLANRLTASGQHHVLLLEAGGEDKKQEIHIPAAFSKLFKSELDWNYSTEPEPEMDNRTMYWPRGKVLGGCSSINAMIYIRGNVLDYDHWAELGNPGWSYKEVLPYFKKAENQERGASSYHGVGGPLNVADLRDPNPLSRAFIQAAQECGYPLNPDFNTATQDGFGFFQVTQKGGRRNSTAVAYLKPARNRPNLTVETNALATAILFEGQRAVGVRYLQNGQTKEARADREVILAGGAINSPQLLMLSGVGPAGHLAEYGLPVVRDLPGVGQNLQDHLIAGAVYSCTQPLSLAHAEKFGQLAKFLLQGKGMLTSNVAEAGGFLKTRPDLAMPDIQFHFAPAYFVNHGFQKIEGDGFSVGAILVHPRSRGRLCLKSPDPQAAPAIFANYASDPEDMDTLIKGVQIARKIAHSAALAPYRKEEVFPSRTPLDDDETIRNVIRQLAATLYHPVGTCKMGNDPLAVVDSKLRVHGLDGLRVIDASIMPLIPGGNTNAPTIMIAEKGADMILSKA